MTKEAELPNTLSVLRAVEKRTRPSCEGAAKIEAAARMLAVFSLLSLRFFSERITQPQTNNI
jgi:hypothetical protein